MYIGKERWGHGLHVACTCNVHTIHTADSFMMSTYVEYVQYYVLCILCMYPYCTPHENVQYIFIRKHRCGEILHVFYVHVCMYRMYYVPMQL